ncbi:MAG: DUF2786 domain-containing protein, partial [Patescibacteria group bacterium]|nr:DUF2786 domain-containing protein [Patescibacteria group bacterium]
MSEPVDLVRKLVALSLFNENANEARSALSQARKLIAKHDIKQDALFMPDGEAKGWSPADFMQAAEKAKDVLAVGKAALSDP